MFARPARILIVTLLFACFSTPAFAVRSGAPVEPRSSVDQAVHLLESIAGIRIGATTNVVTIQNSPKARPMVIDYGAALRTGVLGVNNDGTSSRLAHGDANVPRTLPKGLTLGQIGAILLGLAIVSYVVSIARQVAPARSH